MYTIIVFYHTDRNALEKNGKYTHKITSIIHIKETVTRTAANKIYMVRLARTVSFSRS